MREFVCVNRRVLRVLASMTSAAALVLPTTAAGSQAGDTTTPIIIRAQHAASVDVAFPSTVTLTPTLRHPGSTSCEHRPSWVSNFVGLEITPRAPSPFVYFAFAWCNAHFLSGWWADNLHYAYHAGFHGGSHRPRHLDAMPVRLPAGRYRIVVLTRNATTVKLSQAPANRSFARTVTATRPVDFDERGASFTHGAAYRALPLRVPSASHLALFLHLEGWEGLAGPTVRDVCLSPGVEAPCAYPPVIGGAPGIPPTTGSSGNLVGYVWPAPRSGASQVNFYAVDPGRTTGQTYLALALP